MKYTCTSVTKAQEVHLLSILSINPILLYFLEYLFVYLITDGYAFEFSFEAWHLSWTYAGIVVFAYFIPPMHGLWHHTRNHYIQMLKTLS